MNRPILTTILSALFFTIIICPTVEAYSLRKSQSDEVLIWKNSSLQVAVNTDKLPDIGGVYDAIRASFDIWVSSGMPMDVNLHDATGADIGSGDGQHGVTWLTSDWPYDSSVVAMTVAMYNPDTALVSETDILLNARDYGWTTSPSSYPDRYDVQNVVTHEVGHFFGLGHEEQDLEATMFPTTPPGETGKRSLTADDRAGIAAIIEEMNLRGAQWSASAPSPALPPGEMARSEELQSSGPLPSRGAVGCSASGVEAAGSWWLLIGLFGLALSSRRRRGIIVLGLAVLVPSAAEATVVRALSLEDLAQGAGIVVQAQVVSQRSSLEGKLIYTDTTVAVDRCLKGNCRATVVLRTLGGEVEGQGMYVEGMPRLKAGQRIILFARPLGERLISLGMAQGVFHLAGKVAHRDLKGLSLLRQRVLTQGAAEQITLAEILEALRRMKPLPPIQ